MVIIRNPYVRVSVGVSWEITAATSPPAGTGYPGDIVLVFPEGAEIPSVAKLEQVGVYNDLEVSEGNKYPENGVFLFGGIDGTPGEAEILLVDKQNLRIDINASKAVVNIEEMQVECDAYAWDIRDEKWVKFEYIELPVGKVEKVKLIDWYTKGVDASNIQFWSIFNPQETLSHLANENVYDFTEAITAASWNAITNIPTNVTFWSQFSSVDSGTITKNENPIPF